MSSTNRSNARDKHIADYYVTPQQPIRDFLDVFCKDELIDLSSQKHLILDPCAWWDEVNDMSYPAVLFEYGADDNKIITNDIREDSPASFKKDFLNNQFTFQDNEFDIVITNPPFNIAQDIINRALEVCKEWGYVIMLLRLNYFWSKERVPFWKKNIPIRTYVHSKRMNFITEEEQEKRKKEWLKRLWWDSIEYMHCVWKKWENPSETKLKLIYDF